MSLPGGCHAFHKFCHSGRLTGQSEANQTILADLFERYGCGEHVRVPGRIREILTGFLTKGRSYCRWLRMDSMI